MDAVDKDDEEEGELLEKRGRFAACQSFPPLFFLDENFLRQHLRQSVRIKVRFGSVQFRIKKKTKKNKNGLDPEVVLFCFP